MSNKILSILFLKGGFSFCIFKQNELAHAEKVSFDERYSSLSETLEYSFKQHLYLNQDYDQVNVSFLSQQFNLVPNSYFEKEKEAQKWLEFSSEIFQGDVVLDEDLENLDTIIVYAYPEELQSFVRTKFNVDKVSNASKIFIDSIQSSSEESQLFLNIHPKQIEILVYNKGKLQLYNIFNAETKEDVVYYVLNCLKQLDLDPNEVRLYYFGWALDNPNLKMLMNFVRHVMPGSSDISELNYFTEIQNSK